MKIRTQSVMNLVIFGIIFIIVAVLLLATNQQCKRLKRQEDIAGNIERTTRDLSFLSNAYLLYGEHIQRLRWETIISLFSPLLSNLKPDNREQQTLVENIKENQKRLKTVFDDVKSTLESGLPTRDPANHRVFLQVSWSRIQVLNQGMISDALRLSHLFRDQENQLKQRTVILVLGLIGTFIAYFFFNFLLTNRRVLKSMNDLQEGAKIVGSGDLDYVVPVKHKDEIGDLSQAFNRMTSSLRIITASKIELEREITERLRAEEELRISEARLRAVFNALAEGIIFVNKDGQYEEMNNAVEIIFGYSRDLIADPPLDPRSLLLRGDGTPLPVNEQPSIVALRTGATVRNVEIGAPKSDGTIAWISVNSQPVRDDQGNMLGVVSSLFDITERKRTEEELHQRTLELQQLTETLEARVKERTEDLAELSRRLVSAQESERERISYELHDNVWQNLVAIRFAIENLFSGPKDPEDLKSQSKEIMTALLDTVQRIRTMQGDLWPYVLDDIGLVATLFWYCREFEKHHPGLAVKITDGITETDIPPAHKIVIYRILQEALNNVAKHSRADQVTIRLRTRDHDLEFSIEDNGLGFDPQEAFVQKAPWGGLGLLNIKARTELSGGTFEIESEKGKGTMVRAAWNI